LLKKWRKDAETTLTEAAKGRIRRALTADGGNDLTEVEAYYTDTIRPELSRYGLDNSNAFTRVRERLTWWVDFVPGQQPELLLVCLPPNYPGADDIPVEARFTSREVEKLAEAIHNVACIQAAGCAKDLTQNWFEQRLSHAVGFLERAALPLLKYEHGRDGENLSYLIARDKELSGKYKSFVFQHSGNTVIQKELPGGEATRFTAMTLWQAIPLSSIEVVKSAYAAYRHREKLHLYPQERAATLYEDHIRKQSGLRGIIIPPNLTLMLVEPQLVTLFCQAFFGGLIALKPGVHDHPWDWCLEAIGPFGALPLAPGNLSDPKSLAQALREFTLERPNKPGIKNEINPAEHFGGNRAEFLAMLHDAAYQRRSQRSDKLIAQIEDWQCQDDEFVHAFAALLAAEWKQPMWKDWEYKQETE
jgi:hypothetical protein